MEIERDLAAILSQDPNAPVDLRADCQAKNPAFFIPLQVGFVREIAESMQLHSTLTRCDRLLLVIKVEPSLARIAHQLGGNKEAIRG